MKLRPQLTIFTTLLFASGWFACSSEPEVFRAGDGELSIGDGDSGDGDNGGGDIGSLGDGDGDGDSGDGDSGDGETGDGDSGDGDTGLGGGLFVPEWEFPDNITFDYTPVLTGDDSCGSEEGTPESVSRPIDIIFIIDNSSSMNNEIEEVQANIRTNFASIIEVSGIDYRVIMLSRYGDSENGVVGDSDSRVCIPDPLGGHDCVDPDTKMPINTERFFHYSVDIESRNALCALLESYDEPDEFAQNTWSPTTNDGGIRATWTSLAPNGWQQWLREDAFKTFVMISDDDARCSTNWFSTAVTNDRNFIDLAFDDESEDADADNMVNAIGDAAAFDAALLSLSATQFGTATDRNYVWHSIIGMGENDPVDEVWGPDAAVMDTRCNTGSSGEGFTYQNLSRTTGGVRFPICPQEGETNFDPVFNEIAQGVIETAAIPCEFDFPEVDGIINEENIKVRYTASAGGDPVEYSRGTDDTCGDGQDFYFDDNDNPTKLFLCPTTCTNVQDDGGELKIDFGCLGT